MILYHGSIVVVDEPKVLIGERLVDFGAGFYTTTNRAQAVRWAQRVSARRSLSDQFISEYEFDSSEAKKELRIIYFNEPDGLWLDFVCANRSGREPTEPYDIVFGPVANDTVYTVVQFYENGIYDKDEAIKRLKVQPLYNQVLFHTENALTFCKYKGFKRIGGDNG